MSLSDVCTLPIGRMNPNDSDTSGSRPLRPFDAIDVGTVDKCSEDELAALIPRSCCMDSNGEAREGGCAQRMHHTETLLG